MLRNLLEPPYHIVHRRFSPLCLLKRCIVDIPRIRRSRSPRSRTVFPYTAWSLGSLRPCLRGILTMRRGVSTMYLKRRAFSFASLPHRNLRAHDAREVRLHGCAVGTMDGPEAEYGLVARRRAGSQSSLPAGSQSSRRPCLRGILTMRRGVSTMYTISADTT